MKSKKELLDTLKNNLFKNEENKKCYQSLIDQIEIELADNASKNFKNFNCQLLFTNSKFDDKDVNLMLKLIESHYFKHHIVIDVLNFDTISGVVEINVYIGNFNYTREDLKRLYNNSLSDTIEREAHEMLNEISLKFEKEVINNKNINYKFEKDIINEKFNNDVIYNILTKVTQSLIDLDYNAHLTQSKNNKNNYKLHVQL